MKPRIKRDLTLRDYIEMERMEIDCYGAEHTTPAMEAMRWAERIPTGILAAADARGIAGFVNLFPVDGQVFALLRRVPVLNEKIDWLEKRAHLKGRVVRKYRLPGLIILVGIPLPGTGAWTGALVAALLDIRMRHALPAILLGLIIAGAITTAVTMGVISLF